MSSRRRKRTKDPDIQNPSSTNEERRTPAKKRRMVGKEEDDPMDDTGQAVPNVGDQDEGSSSRFAVKQLIFTVPREDPQETPVQTDDNVPPFIVPHTAKNQLKLQAGIKSLLIANLPLNSFVVKNFDNVNMVRVSSAETYAQTKLLFRATGLDFYTYSNVKQNLKKFVLYDLVEDDAAFDIAADLHGYGLRPVEIKPMRVLKPRYKGHINYIVMFDAEDRISLNMLKRVKYVCSTVVSWNVFRTKVSDVIQCMNCCRFNHHKQECFMQPVCILCAKNHPVSECPLTKRKLEMGLAKVPSFLLKCANCNKNHSAIWQFCEKRVALIEKKENKQHAKKYPSRDAPANRGGIKPAATPIHSGEPRRAPPKPIPPVVTRSLSPPRNPIRMASKKKTGSPAATPLRPSDHPQVYPTPFEGRHGRPKAKPNLKPTPKPVANYQQIANVNNHYVNKLCANNAPKTTHHQPIYQSEYYSNNNASSFSQSNNALFTPQELIGIFQEMLTIISSCKTKQDQLNALINITVKYLPCPE